MSAQLAMMLRLLAVVGQESEAAFEGRVQVVAVEWKRQSGSEKRKGLGEVERVCLALRAAIWKGRWAGERASTGVACVCVSYCCWI